ncbi:CYTH domain-containing protein [Frateuria aurantia]
MAVEIERKFLLRNAQWREQIQHSEVIAQGYLVGMQALLQGLAKSSVRVRLSGEQAWLNIKSATRGVSRAEYEYPVPLADARELLDQLCDGVVEKVRHHVLYEGALFEVDEFTGSNQGLIVAEIELPAVDAAFPRPSWLGAEVSQLERYYNVCLIDHPYAKWSPAEREATDAEAAAC